MLNQESKEIECKSDINEKAWIGWCKTVAAFSNTKGGTLLFGYNDDGSFKGIDNNILDERIRHVEQIIKSHIEPFPVYTICNYDTRGDKTAFSLVVKERKSAITWVLANDNPIMYVRREKMSVPATIEEMQNALLLTQLFDYDNTGVGIYGNIKLFSKLNEYYKKANEGMSLIENDLISLNLTTNESILTITGALFADNSNYRNANVICNTWPDTTKGTDRVSDSKVLQGSALELFEFMMNYIKNVPYYSFGGIKHGAFFDDDGSFSIVSLREAVINSIAHRDYKISGSEIVLDCYPDRIEITSPGSMMQGKDGSNNMELKAFPSLRRNPNICRVFVKCRLMEEKGSGFAKIIEDYKKMGEVFQPTCFYNQKMFTICLKNKKYKYDIPLMLDNPITNPFDYLIQEDMFKTRSQIYDDKPKIKLIEALIRHNPKTSYEQIQNEFNLSREGAKYYIRQLKDACLIRRVGNNLSGYYEIVNDIDRPNQFLCLDSDIQSKVLKWCNSFFTRTKSFNEKHTSYGLKHILQEYDGTYLTNGEFKGAMLLSGFQAKDLESINWVFNIAENSAALKLKLDS